MSALEEALDLVLRWEGGYVHDPADAGGETYRGISRRAHPKWAGWEEVDREKPKPGQIILWLEEPIREFYRVHYWDAVEGGRWPREVAIVLTDFAVNSGAPRAIRALQRAVGAKPDGKLGDRTHEKARAELQRVGAVRVAKSVLEDRGVLFVRLAVRRPGNQRFLVGWMRRLADNLKTIS